MTSEYHPELEVTDTRVIRPTVEILNALKQNYPIWDSVADLVDNSIDAGATNVQIRFIKAGERLVSLCIADNGHGIRDEAMDAVMQFAKRREYSKQDLGMFGVGLKTASLSQAQVLSVMSRAKGSKATGRQWNEVEMKKQEWRCNVLSEATAAAELALDWGSLRRLTTGTVVRWDKVREFDRLRPGEADAFFERVRDSIAAHLGLKLHRFLEDQRIHIEIDILDSDTGEVGTPRIVGPLNPFPKQSGHPDYPKTLRTKLHGEIPLELKAHIWPRKSKDPGYKLGSGQVADRQGLYFYRHDRLIQAGGWNGWHASADPHYSLARVAIDIPDDATSYLEVRSNKAGIDTPPTFVDALHAAKSSDGTTLEAYAVCASDVYRTNGQQREQPILRPGEGIPADVKDALERSKVPFKGGLSVTMKWGFVARDDFFTADPETETIILNDKYRKGLLRGDHGGKTDLPILRTLLYFLLCPTLDMQRQSKQERGRLRAIQSALVAAAKAEMKKGKA